MYVKVAAEESDDVRGRVVRKFGFEGVEVFGRVVRGAVEEAEKERSGGGVYGEPESFSGGRFFEFVGCHRVVAGVDGNSSVVKSVQVRRGLWSVAS